MAEDKGKRERLFSLDLLRGIDMFYLSCGGALIPAVLKWLDAPPAYLRFLQSHPWRGFTLYDLIMPLFIFMCGAAVPFALGRRLGPDGKPDAGYWRHVWGRVALMWGLGMLAQGDLATLDIHRIALYSNTLQTIAVGYLAAAVLLPVRRVAVKVVVPLALLLAYGLIVHFGGDYTKDGNISQKIDLAVWGALLPKDSAAVENIRTGGYSWLLPSMMFPVITLAGCFSTQILRCGRLGEWRRAAWLLAFGGASLAAGWALYFLGVDMVKHIFTVSFTMQAIGWSVLLLAILYVVTDIWKLRRGLGLFILFGQFALTAYLCETVFRDAVQAASDRLFIGVERFFPADFVPVVKAVGFSVVITFVLLARRRMAERKK
jgi:predicted acyltransferase